MLQNDIVDVRFENTQNATPCLRMHPCVVKLLKGSGRDTRPVHVGGDLWGGRKGKGAAPIKQKIERSASQRSGTGSSWPRPRLGP